MFSNVIIAGYCLVGVVVAIIDRAPNRAAIIVARGALLWLTIKTIVTLIRAMELGTWNQIGIFVSIFFNAICFEKNIPRRA